MRHLARFSCVFALVLTVLASAHAADVLSLVGGIERGSLSEFSSGVDATPDEVGPKVLRQAGVPNSRLVWEIGQDGQITDEERNKLLNLVGGDWLSKIMSLFQSGRPDIGGLEQFLDMNANRPDLAKNRIMMEVLQDKGFSGGIVDAVRRGDLVNVSQLLSVPLPNDIMKMVLSGDLPGGPDKYGKLLEAFQSGSVSSWFSEVSSLPGVLSSFGGGGGGGWGGEDGGGDESDDVKGQVVPSVPLTDPKAVWEGERAEAGVVGSLGTPNPASLDPARRRAAAVAPYARVAGRVYGRAVSDTMYSQKAIEATSGQGFLQASRQEAYSALKMLQEILLENLAVAAAAAAAASR